MNTDMLEKLLGTLSPEAIAEFVKAFKSLKIPQGADLAQIINFLQAEGDKKRQHEVDMMILQLKKLEMENDYKSQERHDVFKAAAKGLDVEGEIYKAKPAVSAQSENSKLLPFSNPKPPGGKKSPAA